MSNARIEAASKEEYAASQTLEKMLDRTGQDVLTVIGDDRVMILAKGESAKFFLAVAKAHGAKLPPGLN